MADALAVELHALGSEDSSSSSSAFDIGARRSLLKGTLRVTTVTGSGSGLELSVESSPDGENGWRTVWTAGALKAGALRDFTVDRLERFIRLSWALSGITAAEFVVNSEAHALYATRRDLHLQHLDERVTADEDQEAIAECLLSATDDAETALNANYPLPLTAWPSSLTLRCGAIAKYRIFTRIGFAPQGVDELILKDHDDAQKWLKLVAERKIMPPGLTPNAVEPVRASSGNPCNPTAIPPRMSDNWGDFG